MQLATWAIYNTCNLQQKQLAICVTGNMCTSWTDQLDGQAGRTSWTDQLDGPAGRISLTDQISLFAVCIFKDSPFSLYIVAASKSDEGLFSLKMKSCDKFTFGLPKLAWSIGFQENTRNKDLYTKIANKLKQNLWVSIIFVNIFVFCFERFSDTSVEVSWILHWNLAVRSHRTSATRSGWCSLPSYQLCHISSSN